MNTKKKILVIILSLVMILSIPSMALAAFDDYGFNANARMFKGTMDNWEAYIRGLPSTPWESNQLDVIYVERKWDKLFDPVMYHQLPLGPGAWQKVNVWQQLSGEQQGWTWHLDLEVVYSPNAPIPGAIALSVEEMGLLGFYCVKQVEWLKGPNGQKNYIQNLEIKNNIIKKALKVSY